MTLISQIVRQTWLPILLMGAAYGCMTGLIFVPLLQIYPQFLKPLWPFLLMSLVFICLMVSQTPWFDQDLSEGILEWFYVHQPHFIGYLIAKFLTYGVGMVLVIGSVTIVFGLREMDYPMFTTLILTQALAIATLSALHMAISSLLLKVPSYRRAFLHLVILLPLAVPEILLSYGMIEAGHFDFHLESLFVLFLSMSILIIMISLAITPLALREALRD